MDIYFKRGLIWGLTGTLAMSIVMIAGTVLQISPMPAPVPVALAKWVLGDLPKPVLMITGMVFHFIYGGIAGILFSKFLKDTVVLWHGLVWGLVLWLGMQLVFLPLLGWGIFGTGITPKIAVVTLVLHLLYGSILGAASHRAISRSKT